LTAGHGTFYFAKNKEVHMARKTQGNGVPKNLKALVQEDPPECPIGTLTAID
jgi:hypothetical protein